MKLPPEILVICVESGKQAIFISVTLRLTNFTLSFFSFLCFFFVFGVDVKFILIRKILTLMLCLRTRVLLQKHWKGNFISLRFGQNYCNLSVYESMLYSLVSLQSKYPSNSALVFNNNFPFVFIPEMGPKLQMDFVLEWILHLRPHL